MPTGSPSHSEQLTKFFLQFMKEQAKREADRLLLDKERQNEDRKIRFLMEDARIKLEEKRLEAESELQIRREEQYRREKEDRKRANIRQTLKTWDDTTEAEAYLENFEAIMREADIPEIDWPSTLRKQHAGRALSIFRELSLTEETSYQTLKKDLIERLGTILQQTRCAIWLDRPKPDQDPRSFLQQTCKALNRMKPMLEGVDEVLNEMFTGVILRNYSNEAILHINQHPNTSHYHKVEALQELWEAKGFHEKKKLLRHQTNEEQQYQQRRRQDG